MKPATLRSRILYERRTAYRMFSQNPHPRYIAVAEDTSRSIYTLYGARGNNVVLRVIVENYPEPPDIKKLVETWKKKKLAREKKLA